MNVFLLDKGLLKGLNGGEVKLNIFAPCKAKLINPKKSCCQVKSLAKYNVLNIF
jgi:hypothetical protein